MCICAFCEFLLHNLHNSNPCNHILTQGAVASNKKKKMVTFSTRIKITNIPAIYHFKFSEVAASFHMCCPSGFLSILCTHILVNFKPGSHHHDHTRQDATNRSIIVGCRWYLLCWCGLLFDATNRPLAVCPIRAQPVTHMWNFVPGRNNFF